MGGVNFSLSDKIKLNVYFFNSRTIKGGISLRKTHRNGFSLVMKIEM